MKVKQTIAGLREFSMRRRAKTGLVLCPALGLALLQLSAAEPENSQDRETLTFEVSGTVDYKSLTQTLPPSKRYYQKVFSLSVSNCNWQIKVQDLGLFNIQSAQDIIFGCEDSYLYEVAHFHSGATNAVVAVAEKMPVPRPDNSLASIIWLAFCSGGYFDQRTNNMAHPVWFVDSRARNGLFQADADLHEDAARLPRSVIWRIDRRYHVPLEWNAPMEEQPLPGPLRGKEYVTAKYQVLETMPLGEIHLPKEASFLRYSPTHSGTNTRPIYEVVVKVEKATPTLSLASMIPTMPEGTVYSERRFTSEGQRNWFSVISTNGHFPPVEGLASLGEKVNQTAINVPGHRRRVWLGRILILLVIFSCPLSIWYSRKITPNLENNGQNKPKTKQ